MVPIARANRIVALDLPGFGASDKPLGIRYWLVDRKAGKGMIVTLWENEEAMRASEQSRLKRQGATAAATGAKVTTDRYEVVDSLVM